MKLSKAAEIGSQQIVEQMLQDERLSHSQSEIADALRRAATNGYSQIVEILVDRADMTYFDQQLQMYTGTSALTAAITNNQFEIATYLLERGANVNGTDQFGATPLHWAVEIEILDARNANAPQGRNVMPHASMTELLIKFGADVNAVDKRGTTPLSRARNQHPRAEKILREHGAND